MIEERVFKDQTGREWIVTAREESTPRHHGRWYLVFLPADSPDVEYPMNEIRWKNAETAARTIATMSPLELAKRLTIVRQRRGEALSESVAR